MAGVNVNPIVLVVLLWVFLTIIIAGSFACIQVLSDAIEAKEIGNIVNMIVLQIAVAFFQCSAARARPLLIASLSRPSPQPPAPNPQPPAPST